MSDYARKRMVSMFHGEPTEADLTELLGDILEYCRSKQIRMEKLIIDAVLERAQ